MKNFLKQLLTSTLAFVIGSVVVLVLMFMFISGRLSRAAAPERVEIADNSVLVLRLSGDLAERVAENPFAELMSESEPQSLQEYLKAIRAAQTDDRIKGIYLDLRFAGGGYASFEALRRALAEFKAAGKWILAHGEIYTEKTLFLASVADSVLLYPTGAVEWNGLVSNQVFLRGFLDKWGLKPILFRVGMYKSAAENVTERRLSDANREQIQTLLNDMWGEMLKAISESRNLPVAQLDSIASQLRVVTARNAVENRLVDALAHEHEVRSLVRGKLGIPDDEKVAFVRAEDYAEQLDPSVEGGKIAVIYAVGEIAYGEGDDQAIGNFRLCRQIREAASDTDVKAIVLRVNSPGGSALASDMIWSEIVRAKEKKPIVASLGDVAASGGYYIAAPCSKIVAEPTTITGSIGVIGLLLNTEQFMTTELGLTFDRVYSHNNQFADLANPNRTMTEFERTKVQAAVDQVYRDFLTVVAKGRGFANPDSVHPIAQGRVWSGRRAMQMKLVDELGGLDRALALAAEMAGLQAYQLLELPRKRKPLEQLLDRYKADEDDDFQAAAPTTGPVFNTRGFLPKELQQAFRLIRLFSDARGVYAYTFVDPSAIQ